ncbi:MAG: L-threonylcarbamoyladenylate synthase [Candidatus ainarchaeum sp.]|nr:L-threonylcarbamoyladenylate synthase [Candidatus ainarchaeum sp.]
MKTQLIKINSSNKNKVLSIAADLIKKGDVVAFPTETVYGLGANALDENAVKKIFVAKGRPNDNPLIVHISNINQLNELVEFVPKKAEILIKKYWPGPLTIVMKKSFKIPMCITGGLNTVAIRMPSDNNALELIKKSGCPIAAPSANSSTKPSPTMAKHVMNDLNGKIPLIIDGGKCKVGLESTVIGLSNDKAILFRPGKITKEEIGRLIGKVDLPCEQSKIPSSPGMKYKHYSPKAKITLVEAKINTNKKETDFLNVVKKFSLNESNDLIGIISFTKRVGFENEFFFNKSVNLYAKNLFFVLREFDKRGLKKIIVEGVNDNGFGLALMNRLRKASSKII